MSLSAPVLSKALRRLLRHAIEESAALGEVQPVGSPTRSGLVQVEPAERLSVSRHTLECLALLAGFDGLAAAFKQASLDKPRMPALH
jgi:hypothetical protein